MREIRLSDGTRWRLRTINDLGGGGGRDRRRLTYVWVACTDGDVELRLMFAASWDTWPDASLVRALEREIERETERVTTLRPPA
jgi:hypothetical protein